MTQPTSSFSVFSERATSTRASRVEYGAGTGETVAFSCDKPLTVGEILAQVATATRLFSLSTHEQFPNHQAFRLCASGERKHCVASGEFGVPLILDPHDKLNHQSDFPRQMRKGSSNVLKFKHPIHGSIVFAKDQPFSTKDAAHRLKLAASHFFKQQPEEPGELSLLALGVSRDRNFNNNKGVGS